MKSDLNSNACQWKHMAKAVCDYVKEQKAQNPHLSDKLGELSVDEIAEFAMHDCTSKLARKELTAKRARKVFINAPITLRIVLRNTLSVPLDIENIKVVCGYKSGDSVEGAEKGTMYTQEAQTLALEPLQQKEVVLRVVPLQSGDFEIERIEWELFKVVRCSRQLSGFSEVDAGARPPRSEDCSLKFKVIEASGECDANIVLHGQDLQRDWRMIHSECKKGVLRIQNCSSRFKIKDAFVSCSHPLVFNFLNDHLFDELAPGQNFDLPI